MNREKGNHFNARCPLLKAYRNKSWTGAVPPRKDKVCKASYETEYHRVFPHVYLNFKLLPQPAERLIGVAVLAHYFGDGELKIFLLHVQATLAKGKHTRFSAN